MAKIVTIFSEYAPLLNMIARKCGILILPKRHLMTFSTDGKVMYVPEEGELKKLSEDAAIGAIIHEGAHCAYTDFSAAQGLTGLEFSVLNLLEDIRVEQIKTIVLPGAAFYLDALVRALLSPKTYGIGGWWGINAADGTQETKVSNIIYRLGRMLRFDVLRQNVDRCNGKLDAQEEAVAQTAYALATSALASAKQTKDLVDAAKRIADLLVKQQSQQSQQGQQGQQGQQEGQGQQSQQGQQEGQGRGGNEGESQAKPGSEIGGTKESEQAMEKRLRNMEVATDLIGALERGAPRKFTNQKGRQMAAQREETVPKVENAAAEWEPDEDAHAAAMALSRDIERALIAKSDEEFDEKRGTRVNQSLLAQYRTKSEVFVREEFEDRVNTDVVILVDESGSMKRKQKQARTACYAIEMALKRIPDISATWILFSDKIRLVPKKQSASRILDPARDTHWCLAAAAGIQALHRSSSDRRRLIITITDGDVGHDAAKMYLCMKACRFEHHALGIGLSEAEEDLVAKCADSVTFVGEQDPIDEAICKVFIRSLMPKSFR